MNKHHKEILSIALPSIVSNITVPLLGLIDLTIVGHLGSTVYIGAIAIGSMIFNMIYWTFGFLRMGTSGLTAQAFGQQHWEETDRTLFRSLCISWMIALGLVLLQYPLIHILLYFIAPSQEVAQSAQDYFYVCVWGAPASLALTGWNGWFIGMQNSRYPMTVAIVQNCTNIFASVFFVFGCSMKVEGIALGTVIAQYTGLMLSIYYGKKMLHHKWNAFTVSALFETSAMKRFFQVNRDIFLRTLCLIAVTAFFTSASASFGDRTLAANTLLLQLFTLFSYFMDGFAYAGEALTGKYWGANNQLSFHRTILHLWFWGGLMTLIFTTVYAVAGTPFLHLLTNQEEVIQTALQYYSWVLAIPIVGIAAFILDGICIGTTSTGKMLQSMCIATITFFIVYFLTEKAWGNHGLWLAFISYLAMRGMAQAVLVRRLLALK